MRIDIKQFWNDIEKQLVIAGCDPQTAKDAADFGFSDINEDDLRGVTLRGVTRISNKFYIECDDLAAAALDVLRAYEAFAGLE